MPGSPTVRDTNSLERGTGPDWYSRQTGHRSQASSVQ